MHCFYGINLYRKVILSNNLSGLETEGLRGQAQGCTSQSVSILRGAGSGGRSPGNDQKVCEHAKHQSPECGRHPKKRHT